MPPPPTASVIGCSSTYYVDVRLDTAISSPRQTPQSVLLDTAISSPRHRTQAAPQSSPRTPEHHREPPNTTTLGLSTLQHDCRAFNMSLPTCFSRRPPADQGHWLHQGMAGSAQQMTHWIAVSRHCLDCSVPTLFTVGVGVRGCPILSFDATGPARPFGLFNSQRRLSTLARVRGYCVHGRPASPGPRHHVQHTASAPLPYLPDVVHLRHARCSPASRIRFQPALPCPPRPHPTKPDTSAVHGLSWPAARTNPPFAPHRASRSRVASPLAPIDSRRLVRGPTTFTLTTAPHDSAMGNSFQLRRDPGAPSDLEPLQIPFVLELNIHPLRSDLLLKTPYS
ncbi:hypothetical protein C8R43DRAFT_1170160 [Mycena crocata]|nr:hypothetical protein C8R43DRAFT_1170160 [Mycena crocata]